MSHSDEAAAFYKAEIDNIDATLEALSAKTEELRKKRSELVRTQRSTDYSIALDFIEDLGLSQDDLLELINRELTNRRWEASERSHRH